MHSSDDESNLQNSPDIDSLDRKILRHLLADARKPFLEIARLLKVSGGTIHARFAKLKEAGIIRGSTLIIDRKRLGSGLAVFVGITVDQATHVSYVSQSIAKIPEVLEIHYTTGDYALFTKLAVRDTDHLHRILSEKIQHIDQVRSTHTIVILKSLVERDVTP